jgi:large subunit ribosomal protein L24
MVNAPSIQPRKQRKTRANEPLHLRHARLGSHLNETLLVKYNRRSFPLVKGDTVKVMRGAFRGHEDKVASVDLKIGKVTVEGVTTTKADGTKKARPVDPSNLLITRLNLTDPLRRDRLLRTGKVDAAKREELKKELELEAKAQKAEIEKFKKALEERERQEKDKRAAEGEVEAKVDPVTQKPILAPKEEEKHEHVGGEHLEKSRDETQKEEK